jgi:hypothetical protein
MFRKHLSPRLQVKEAKMKLNGKKIDGENILLVFRAGRIFLRLQYVNHAQTTALL